MAASNEHLASQYAKFFLNHYSGSSNEPWGNVFLTDSWVLYIDWTRQQHDAAIERLCIDRHSILLSGCMHREGGERINFRTPRSYEILSEDEILTLMEAIRQTVF